MIVRRVIGIGAAALMLSAAAGLAQTSTGEKAAAPAAKAPSASTGDARRDNLFKMQKAISIEMNDTPLEDVFKYIADTTGADIEPLWKSESESDGYEKDTRITINAKAMPALTFLEKVLERLDGGSTANSWQMSVDGPMQIGPKDRLNKFKRVEIYDINDLLFILPVYDNAPNIDLNQVLQAAGRGGGGGGRSPFRDNQNRRGQQEQRPDKEERARDVVSIITSIVDNEQWADGGGEGGTIRYHEGTLIINAADYLHRQVNGYKWWPSIRPGATAGARRYVSLNVDTSIGQLERPIRTLPVTGTVGGRPPGGGG